MKKAWKGPKIDTVEAMEEKASEELTFSKLIKTLFSAVKMFRESKGEISEGGKVMKVEKEEI